MGLHLRGLEPGVHYQQITLVDNAIRPNESFTAFIPDVLAQGLELHVFVHAELSGYVVGDSSNWVIETIEPV